MTIDRAVYDAIYTSTVAQYIGLGLDLMAARAMAKEAMERSFVADDVVDLRDMETMLCANSMD